MWSTLRYIFKYQQKNIDRCMLYASLACSLLVLFHIGYNTDAQTARSLDSLIVILFYALVALSVSRTFLSVWASRRTGPIFYGGVALAIYFLVIGAARTFGTALDELAFLQHDEWIYLGIFVVFLTELSKSTLFFDSLYFNPTILFVISFLVLILAGTLLLLLPKTMVTGSLGFVDALFMATSAVCITGLSTVDIATEFTLFGQTVMLILMQVGGLGIMTFTGFFGYFFSGGFSYKNQLMYGEILGQKKVASVVHTLLTIVAITLVFEAVGAVLLYVSVDEQLFPTTEERWFFSLFHTVSAFCNAGFTTVPGGFQHTGLRFAYPVHLIVGILFLLGGLGFGIMLNIYAFTKRWVIQFYRRFVWGKPFKHRAWVISFNSRLVAWATVSLVVGATVLTFILEYDNSLQAHETLFGKWVTAFFMGNTPRSAGFATVDLSSLSLSTVLVLVFMMWIGSSPGSTGGGIKTTTFSVAVLNIISLARGKEHLEIFKRRIAPEAINKAFAIIALSLLAIGLTALLLSITDGEKPMEALVFEAFSAYTTSGLSLGVTPRLSDGGKLVLTLSMFVGRVGLLTLLVALIKNTKNKSYTYPQENVLF